MSVSSDSLPAPAPESLTQRTVRGAAWLAGARVWSQALSLTVGVCLARVLEPDDFGVVAMVTVVTGFFTMLADLGLSTAVVQNQSLTREQLSSIFWFNLLVAIGLAGALAVGSSWVAAFYRRPEIIPLMCVLVLAFPLGALASVHSALLQKELHFAVLTRIQMVSSLAAGLLGVLVASLGGQAWALVTQTMAAALLSLAGVWWASPWRPTRRCVRRDLDAVWGFSLNLLGFQLVNFFFRRTDSFLIGRFLGPAAVGQYNQANALMVYPINNLTSVAQGVLMPAMAQIQGEPARLASAYLRACRLLAFLILPAMAGLAVVAREAVAVIYGPKWSQAGEVLAVLCWVGTFQPFDSLLGTLFVARGFTRWFFLWGLAATVVTVAALVIGLRGGLPGIATSYLFAQLLITVIGVPLQCRKVEVPITGLLRTLAVPALAAAGMALAVQSVKVWLHGQGASVAAIFGSCVATGVLAYGLLLLALRRFFWAELRVELFRLVWRK